MPLGCKRLSWRPLGLDQVGPIYRAWHLEDCVRQAEGNATLCLQVMQRLRELGVLIGKGGLHGNVFRIKPPMCITTDDAEFLTEAFDLALSEL